MTVTCPWPGCDGVVEDGFCDASGHPADGLPAASVAPSLDRHVTTVTPTTGFADPTGPPVSGRSRATGPTRGELGAGLVQVPAVTRIDPIGALLVDPQVPEGQRYCPTCDHPVGRGRDGRPGRVSGFCPKDGTRYSFAPTLAPGVLVGDQYEVLGCLAHGGLGWVYLAVDRNVNDRWVVLKGQLNSTDPVAAQVARAERRFLAEVNHPNIVDIVNFVQHPDDDGEQRGYIVMEYVGGSSLQQLIDARYGAGDGPFPVAVAIAYTLEILLALGHLHDRDRVYCDLKPENAIQYDRQLKLIDLGAMRQIDDRTSPIYGTPGFQAPEIGRRPPSVRSDLYTVGRTLAVMALGVRPSAQGVPTPLPEPHEHPVLRRHESLHRLLRRATDPEPERRFASAAEMADQLDAVLREVLAIDDGCPHLRPSSVFGPPRGTFAPSLLDDAGRPDRPDPRRVVAALPTPLVEADDPAAALLATLDSAGRDEVERIVASVPAPSPELRFRLVRARLDTSEPVAAVAALEELLRDRADPVEPGDPVDWRARWYRGMAELLSGRAEVAVGLFDGLYDLLPGELSVKLALAAAADCAGRDDLAGRFYPLVARTDPNVADGAFGAARSLMRSGRRPEAVAELETVPPTSSSYVAAQLAAAKVSLVPRPTGPIDEDELRAAATRVQNLPLDSTTDQALRIELLSAAVGLVAPGGSRARRRPRAPVAGDPARAPFLGCAWREHDLRHGLEQSLRRAARLSPDPGERVRLVDRANDVRPLTRT